MNDERVVVEVAELCEHGQEPDHYLCDNLPNDEYNALDCGDSCHCPGGSRRTLTLGEYVLIEKVDGEWPDALLDELRTAWANASETHPTEVPWHGYIEAILDRLASVAGKDEP